MRNYIKNALEITEEDNLLVQEILERMRKHFRNKSNIAVDRVAYNKRKQEAGETFDAFYVAIKELAENAELCQSCRNEQLATKIMCDI